MTAAVFLGAVVAVFVVVVWVAWRFVYQRPAEQPRVELWAELADKAEAERGTVIDP